MSQIWKTRRRAIVPALHRRYIASMVAMFGDSMAHGAQVLHTRCYMKHFVCSDKHLINAMLHPPDSDALYGLHGSRPCADPHYVGFTLGRRWKRQHERDGPSRWRTFSAV